MTHTRATDGDSISVILKLLCLHEEETPQIILHLCLDNDQPTITAIHNSPAVEGGSNVVLTCNKDISLSETATSFEWYKNDTLLGGENEMTFDIGNKRDADGNYTCKVVSKFSGTSQESDEILIAFTCKYVLYIL